MTDKKYVRQEMEWWKGRICSIILLAVLSIGTIYAQRKTSVSGVVRDSVTGETLSYVSIAFKNSTIGASSDDNGWFTIQNNSGMTELSFFLMGYEKKDITVRAGQKNDLLEIRLKPLAIQLEEVKVKPKRERYVRKGNPAVELLKKVIERKDSNRITMRDEYKVESYRKLSIALDKFDVDFEGSKLLSKFKFLKNYVDTSEFDGRPVLALSLREELSDIYYRKNPASRKQIIQAKRHKGIDTELDEDGTVSANLDEILKEVNIFDNDISFLLGSFVSPLSSTLGNSYYHYFILDTVDVGGEPCVDLGFVPVNSQSYSFTGHLYITLDGTYAVKKTMMNVPHHINLNYVKNIRIEQDFRRLPDGLWAPDKDNTYIIFFFVDGAQQLFAHQMRSYDKYSYEIENRDSIFRLQGETQIQLDKWLVKPDTFWTNHRHIPVKEKENAIDNLMVQLRSVPIFNILVKSIEILVSGYVPLSEDHQKNKIDFGSMNTLFTFNEVEGFRTRLGGYTTSHLHPNIYLGGYGAYGIKDRRWKYQARITYSFNEKNYHENESPINNLSYLHEYDLYTPGQDFLFTSKDNMFVSLKLGKAIDKMYYLRKNKLQYEKEWLNGLTFRTWLQRLNNEPAGALRYILKDEFDRQTTIKSINSTEWGIQLRYAPGERAFNSRAGKESWKNLSRKNTPVFLLTHQTGMHALGGEYVYNRTEASVSKRIWMSMFGYIDASIKGGRIWDKTPFPFLIMPNTNQSITIQPEAFHMMNALEFVADRYVSFDATYYMRGLILNRIPVLNLLRMREVISFSGVYGSLSDRNNPDVSSNLFLLPEGTRPLGNQPYMEFSVGVENILRILQVNYYRRLSYLDHPDIHKNGFRIALKFSF